jgi:hypothetical protein
LGPDELNGASPDLQCPSRFQLIAPPKRGPFRDLPLLPDSVAYVMLRRGHLEHAWQKVLAGETVVLDGWSGNDIAEKLTLDSSDAVRRH